MITESWRLFLALGLLFSCKVALSEPWLSSRYAQNCTSCHAPGRVNVPATARRCTLSCQGCHTNPNGGGLRNYYGKWNQERFLNSMYLSGYKMNKLRPAETKDQYYTDDRLKKFEDAPEKKKRRVGVEGFPLRETTARLPEEAYDRHNGANEHVLEPDLKKAYMRIPDEDPWRLRRNSYFNGGIDTRYFYMNRERSNGTKVTATFPMMTDVSASVEPFHGLNLVYESRFINGPGENDWYMGATSSIARSAYVMVDDLPFNTFAMYGLYRPLFGHYNPDHTTLYALASGKGYRAVNRAVSVGTAPNVPFLNLHYIMPIEDSSGLSKEQGYAVNAGARWVTLGAYLMFSSWNTTTQDATEEKLTMNSLTGGGTWKGLTISWDATRIQKEATGRKDAGFLLTVENRYRFWEEAYLKFNYETLNTTPALAAGKSDQMSFGLSAFLISSLELDLTYKTLNVTPEASAATKEKSLLAQIHFFY